MCCHLAPATQPERVMKSGEATARQLSRSARGRRAGPPLPSATRTLGEGPPGPRRASGTFRASWCPKELGPLALAGLGFRSPGGAGPVSPCSSPPTHTHHADIRVCRPAAKREFGQNFHIQSKTQSHDWVGEA